MFKNHNTYSKLIIIRADKRHLKFCSRILKDSKLGRLYFSDGKGNYIGEALLLEGFDKDDIYVSFHEDNPSKLIGFSWIQSRGIFNWFPFLHLLAIDKDQRGQGYGKSHLLHFEEVCKREYESDKVFLMVGNYNQKAIELYEGFDYKPVGQVPNLFVQGIDELLFYKEI